MSTVAVWADRPSPAFERFAAGCSVLAGVAGPLYAIAFVVLHAVVFSSVVLLLGGLLTAAALVGVYGRLRAVDTGFAGLALVLGLAGALGAAVHAGFDLATALHPVAGLVPDAPNPVDPRGLLTFGVAGAGLFVVGWLIARGGAFPRPLGAVADVAAILLVLLYLGRLIVLDPANPLILVPALVSGFLASPVFYLWAGWCLARPDTGRRPARAGLRPPDVHGAPAG